MTDSGEAETDTTSMPLRWMTSESFVLGETRTDKAKREKREVEIQSLLADTQKHHHALGDRLRDVKTYMNQEFQSGIATMEMYLLQELRCKAKQLRSLKQQVRVQKASLDEDEEVKREEESVRWFLESEHQLEAKIETDQVALERFKSTAKRLKSEVRTKRNELKMIQLENAHLETRIKRHSLTIGKIHKNVQKSLLPEPVCNVLSSFSLMTELSSTHIGSLRISEIQGYKQLRDGLWKAKKQLKTSRTETKRTQTEQLSKVQKPLILEELFNAGVEALLLSVMELKRTGNMDFSSMSKRAFCSIKQLPENLSNALGIVLQLFDHPEIVQVLRDRVFPARLLSLHSKTTFTKLPIASPRNRSFPPLSSGQFSVPDVSSLLC